MTQHLQQELLFQLMEEFQFNLNKRIFVKLLRILQKRAGDHLRLSIENLGEQNYKIVPL